MKAKLRGLERIIAARKLMEQQSEAAVSRAYGRVRVAEQMLESSAESFCVEAGAVVAALVVADRKLALVAEGVRDAVMLRSMRVEAERSEAADVLLCAQMHLRGRRIEREAAEAVAAASRIKLDVEAARREQAASDDRFLARRRWVQASDRRMKQP